MARPKRRVNWLARGIALVGSAAAFTGFWQLAARNPHPDAQLQPPTATPANSYTLPTGDTPIPLPGAPHSGAGVSR